MEYRQIGKTDIWASVLSFGASSLGSVFRSTDEKESIDVVKYAISAGINYIDTAPWYGQGKAERMLGKALSDIRRDSYYLGTKVGRYEQNIDDMFDFSSERTIRSVDESLMRTGVTHFDIIQVHDMEFAPSLDVIINETLPALEKVKAAGKARYIGITGYPLENFRKVIERSRVKIDTILTYCRCSLNDCSLLEYTSYFKENGIGIINASPISMGLLSERGPPEWHPATNAIKDTCHQASQYCVSKGVDISRLATKYSIENKVVDTTLVSTASLLNLKKNIAAATEDLSSTERDVMNGIRQRFMVPLGNANWEGIEVADYWKQRDQSRLLRDQ